MACPEQRLARAMSSLASTDRPAAEDAILNGVTPRRDEDYGAAGWMPGRCRGTPVGFDSRSLLP